MRRAVEAEAPCSEDVRELVTAASQGSLEAFGKLVKEYQSRVSALAYAFTGSFAQSQEIAQDAFILAWRLLPRLRGPENFHRWLNGIVYNVTRTHRRKQRAMSLIEKAASSSLPMTGADPSPLDHVISGERERVLWDALGRIPERYRIPLVLYYREEQSVESIAGFLGLSEDGVKQRLSRGRRMLQAGIEEMLAPVLSRTRPTKEFTAACIAAAGLLGAGRVSAAPGHFRSAAGKAALVAGLGAMALGGAWLTSRTSARRTDADKEAQARAAGLATTDPAFPFLTGDEPEALAATTAANANQEIEADLPIVFFDFEDGALPADTSVGHVVPGPLRPGNQYALQAGIHLWGKPPDNGGTVMAAAFQTKLGAYREGLAVDFDYWAGAGNGPLNVEVRNLSKNRWYGRYVEVVPEKWTHVTLPMSAFRASGEDSGPPLDVGDELAILGINGGNAAGPLLYVDNVRVAAPPRP